MVNPDVGGEGHRYLLDYKDQLKIRYIDHVSIQRDADSGDKHTPPKGFIEMDSWVFTYAWNLEGREFVILDYQHLILRLSHIKKKERITGSMSGIVSTIWYGMLLSIKPKPTFIDLIKFETDDRMEDAFVIHYRMLVMVMHGSQRSTMLQRQSTE